MTDQDTDDEPGAATSNGDGPGRGRVRVDHVTDELASLRRDVGQQGGLLAELAPRVEDLDGEMIEVRALVRRLIETADEQAVEDQAELEARRAAGLANEPPSPWVWPVMTREDARLAWGALDRWVEHVLVNQQELTLGRLPSCWPAHSAVVAELVALRAAHVAAHTRGAHPTAALSWARELATALDRVNTGIDPELCPPGQHLVTDPAARPSERERKRLAAALCRPEAWKPLLEQVVADDVAWRREPPPSGQ